MASPSVRIRTARNDDLPALHELMYESYMALVEVYDPSGQNKAIYDFVHDLALAGRENNLKEVEQAYLACPRSHFWVAENDKGEVVGSVSITPANAHEADLKSMAVKSNLRGGGVGKRLLEEAFAFCDEKGYLRIKLVTGNPRSAEFYKKNGFKTYQCRASTPIPGLAARGFLMVKTIADKLIRTVAIVGGVHGNERLGVELARMWLQDAHEVTRPTFKTVVVLANEKAVEKNVRYVDYDLNRLFSEDALADSSITGYEKVRAQELLTQLGPKNPEGTSAADFIIDLHSSTANMGQSIIMDFDNDAFAHRVAYHLQTRVEPSLKVAGKATSKKQSYSVDSISPSGFALELGPIAHGTLLASHFAKMRRLVNATLDYINQHNEALLAGAANPSDQRVPVAQVPSMVRTEFPTLEFHHYQFVVDYPRDASGRIAAMLHPNIEEDDWQEIHDGDPLFVRFTGEVLPFKRPEEPPSPNRFYKPNPNEPLYGIFINEAAYYEKGIALAICKLVDKHIY